MDTAQHSDTSAPATKSRAKAKTDVLLKGLGHGVFEIGLGSPGVAILAEVAYTLRALHAAWREAENADVLDVENAIDAAHLRLHAAFELIFAEMTEYKRRAESAPNVAERATPTSSPAGGDTKNLREHVEYLRGCLIEARENAQRLIGVLVMGADDDLGFGEEDVTAARKIGAGLGCNIGGALCELDRLAAKLDQEDVDDEAIDRPSTDE
jgi:hypothetical protein